VSAFETRAGGLTRLMEAESLDLLLVSDLVNVRYLCGFAGTNGVCLVGPGRRIFMTDFRYLERAASEISAYDVVKGKRDLIESVAALVESADGGRRLGFDDVHLSVKQHARLADKLPADVELVPAGGLVERLRAVKDDQELSAMREASRLADDAYRWLIEEHGLVGHTERAVARALVRRLEDAGAQEASFPPIVAAAANGALPHALPVDAPIGRDTLVIVDLGSRVDGYCSDCTRTLATGELDGEAREIYELVHEAQAAALATVRAGVELAAIDSEARSRIETAGRGDQFGHPTGHGVGLEVHEEPRLAPDAHGELHAGNAVTVEPGVYVPGRIGVRIEDLVVVTESGRELLTSVSKDPIVVS
jgi:Xaa-Pro aminopeptidase